MVFSINIVRDKVFWLYSNNIYLQGIVGIFSRCITMYHVPVSFMLDAKHNGMKIQCLKILSITEEMKKITIMTGIHLLIY